jgi:alpha-L-arabinofuranosidase
MKRSLLPVVFLALTIAAHAEMAHITVDVANPGHKVPPTLWGIFFEDINLSADGGIYPEQVRNRSFEDAKTPESWVFESADGKSSASICVADVQAKPPVPPLNPFNRQSLQVKAGGPFVLRNGGYYGMNIVEGDSYTLRLASRGDGGYDAPLHARLVSTGGKELASGEIKGPGARWADQAVTLKAKAGDPKAHLEIYGDGHGGLYLDMVSLMPDRTWKDHGLRPDLAESIQALKPAFLRFPGGCWVEGDDFAHMNHWKDTIGKIDTRAPLWNIWKYNATRGLGYHEYLQLAEDLGAEPLFCINAGMSHKEVVPMDRMGQWVQDALDAIEYANGPVNSVWGSQRAKNGHPAPFNLKYLEIGNENGQAPYAERWKLFAKAIHARYPDMVLIADEWADSHPADPMPKIIDEHYYNNPEWFIWNAGHYDDYDRKGPKIFVGEYAANQDVGKGNLRGAIGEAAFMTGIERNSDVVAMAAYAPLFCNTNHQEWPVNLINFDSSRWYGIPSYYVQKLFAENRGSVVLPTRVDQAPSIKPPYASGCIGLGTWNNAAEFKDLKVVTPDGKVLLETDFSKNIDDWRKTNPGKWSVKDGVLRQSAVAPDITAFIGDKDWTDYTITLKARKLYGENGFQIYFRNQNNQQRIRWDLGGYNDSVHRMDIGVTSRSINAHIEPERWYDVKIEIRGSSVKGYLDGQLVQEVGGGVRDGSCICASAVWDDASAEVIVKVVNASPGPVETKIDLEGAQELAGKGDAIVLTSANPEAENSLDAPTKVSPETRPLSFKGATLDYSAPENSFSVLKLKTRR